MPSTFKLPAKLCSITKFRKSGNSVSRIIILFILISPFSYSQSLTNLEIFYKLVDSSASLILSETPASVKEVDINMNLGTGYSVLEPELISAFNKRGIKTGSVNVLRMIYTIDDARVTYDEMFRDGFLGNYHVSRIISIDGNYLVPGSEVKRFSISKTDTIPVDRVEELENYSYPFTQGEMPTEPFFSGLFEPAVAIGAAAAAVILFFTIRSR